MNYKKGLVFIILILGFILSLFLSLFYRLDLSNSGIILSYIRIPAVIKAVVSGSCLALAGMFLQTISKNPLADPYLTGLSSGAGFGIVLSILFFNSVNYSLFGFFGALISAALVIALSGFSKFSITKLILIGLSVNLFVGSIISFLILTNPAKAYAMTLILTGGFSNADISNKLLVILFLTVIVICALFIPKLNSLRLDSRLVFKSTKEVNTYNIIFIMLAALLTSISVYSAGILGFAGIICPLLTKLLLGNDSRVLFFANIITGSTLLLFSNFLSNNLIYPLQVPLGVVVAIVGVPFFVFFLLRKGGILNN
jgi:iron complex transport system permease protein